MKERITLFIILVGLTVFLYIYQFKFDNISGIVFLLIGMAIYSIYMILADKHRKRKLRKNPQVENDNYRPFVTVMVPCHNEANVIEETIKTVLNLDYPRDKFEVIVIDDRSTDNTSDVVRGLEQKYEYVKAFIRDKDAFPGKSAVLNDAMEFAHGEAILVFDADARFDSDFLKRIVVKLEPQDVGAAQARKVVANKDTNFLTRCQNNEYTLDAHFQVGRDTVKGAVELRGNGEIIKREALEDIGGWNNYTITDDIDMSTRLRIKGWDIRFCIDIVVREEGIVYPKPLYRQRRRWFEGFVRTYLEFFGDVMMSKDVCIRAKLDMIAYVSEVIMPVWLIIEVFMKLVYIALHKTPINSLFSSIIIGLAICVCFFLAIRYSLRKYNKINRFQAIKQGIETTAYMFFLWVPVAFFISLKILFKPRDMDWGKTTHGLVLEAEKEMASHK